MPECEHGYTGEERHNCACLSCQRVFGPNVGRYRVYYWLASERWTYWICAALYQVSADFWNWWGPR